MFYNTIGGHYELNGKMVVYTFPENAYVEINGCRIPLGNLKVESYGGNHDTDSIQHFSNVISLVQPHENKVYNSSIFIDDNSLSRHGYASMEEFKKYKIGYISRQDFNDLQSRAINEKLPLSHPLNIQLDAIIDLLSKKADDNRKAVISEIEKILKSDKNFPKKISIIYDDRKIKHTSHVILEFSSMKKCVLHIDNTISPFGALFPEHVDQIMKDFKFSTDDYEERIPEDKKRNCFLDLYRINAAKPFVSLKCSIPINDALIKCAYLRMIGMIESLGFSISNVALNHRYNQKEFSECVPFAYENKLDFVTQSNFFANETVLQRGARIRAQHAILTYLLKGMDYIPRCSNEEAEALYLRYTKEEWYPNFSDVCSQLNDIIQQMPFNELSKLYLSLGLEGVTKLSDKFKPLILMAMKLKLPLEDYESISFDKEILLSQALIFQDIFAPSAFYNGVNKTVQVSKTWAKQMIDQEQNIEDQNMDGLVRKMSTLLIS